MAVRVLQSSCDADVAVSVTIHKQELDLACRAVEYLRCRCVVNRLISSCDARIVRHIRCILIDSREDVCFVVMDLIAIQGGGVHIGDGTVDICEKERIILQGLEQDFVLRQTLNTYPLIAIVVENRARSVHTSTPFHGSTLFKSAVCPHCR